MSRKDDFACFFCDYWWLFLILFVFIAAIVLTRGIWLSWFGLPVGTEGYPPPISSVLPPDGVITSQPFTPAVSSTPGASTTTPENPPTPAGEQSGYTNRIGGYAFNFPSQWQGTEMDADVQFVIPQRAMASVHLERDVTSIDALISKTQPFSYQTLDQTETIISGYPARCVEMAIVGNTTPSAISCFLLSNQSGYVISLTELDSLDENSLKIIQSQFMDLLASFRILAR